MRFYLSTMADIVMDEESSESVTMYSRQVAAPAARKYGMGLELAEFCISDNLDRDFAVTDATIREKLHGFTEPIVHAPYNELYPCAIDPMARELARKRYHQGYTLAEGYGAKKLVIHSGFVPNIYFPVWFVWKSAEFWREFLDAHPGEMQLCIENVMESEPDALMALMERVDDPRLRLTFDVGHAHVTTRAKGEDGEAVFRWLERCAPWISHFHIHNNAGQRDTHNILPDGGIDMERFLCRAVELCPEASFTVECMESEECARWLWEKGLAETEHKD